MNIIELIAQTRSSVVQILLERNREWIGFGSGFLVREGIITCSHNIRSRQFDAFAIRFKETDPNSPDSYIRIDPEDFIGAESIENEMDYVYLRIWEPEFDNRHIFEFEDSSALSVGNQILFMGFPFGISHLTAHSGYVSSLHQKNNKEVIQIDGSVNGGNSGGPLLDINSGRVTGIVTRALTGFVVEQFKRLIEALKQNQVALEHTQGVMSIRTESVTIDPMNALRVSNAAMEKIAKDLLRSANVGIGFAYSSNYVRDHLERIFNEQ